jgi:hypothetical protein
VLVEHLRGLGDRQRERALPLPPPASPPPTWGRAETLNSRRSRRTSMGFGFWLMTIGARCGLLARVIGLADLSTADRRPVHPVLAMLGAAAMVAFVGGFLVPPSDLGPASVFTTGTSVNSGGRLEVGWFSVGFALVTAFVIAAVVSATSVKLPEGNPRLYRPMAGTECRWPRQYAPCASSSLTTISPSVERAIDVAPSCSRALVARVGR